MSERKQCLGEDGGLPFPNPCKVRVAENSPPDRAPQHRRVIGESGIRNHAPTQGLASNRWEEMICKPRSFPL